MVTMVSHETGEPRKCSIQRRAPAPGSSTEKAVLWIVSAKSLLFQKPRCSMYGIFTYIWTISGVNVDKYSIHGAFGKDDKSG
jgi:hypothetical protein